jgi:hypothetical protein
MQAGSVLLLDESLDARLNGVVNGSAQFSGQIVVQANRRMFLIAHQGSFHSSSNNPA